MMGPCAMEHGVGGRPEQPHAAVPLSGRRSAGASVRPPPHSWIAIERRACGEHHRLLVPHARPASQQGPSRSPRRAGPGSDLARRSRAFATLTPRRRGEDRLRRCAGLHGPVCTAACGGFPWTVPGPVDTSSRPGCANLLRLSAAHPRAPSSRLSARAVGAGATSCVQNLLQIRSWSRWSWALVGNAQRGPQGEGVNITPPCAGPPSCARADCPC